MNRCHCNAPAIYQGACLFHQDPSGVRPNIDTYTGQIRRTPEEQRAAELAARRAMAKEKKAPKVIRPVKERKPARVIDRAAVIAAYEQGKTVRTISDEMRFPRNAVSALLKDAGLLVTREVDVEAVRTEFLAGLPLKEIGRRNHVSVYRIRHLTEDLTRRPIVGQKPTPIDEAQAVALYRSGRSARSVARELSVSEKRVLDVLRERGETRPNLFGEVA